ncbi:hypothetical protein [Vreelandella venusta]|uniref:hypothetical protein n=1 Tax=Vreelandella venusta TaxID=44935 RepID=UPI001170AC4B|nr:hypothetical protein [Halomonas venusta]GEK52387.1 hypothetical protein HVE01_31080 [Halomonas venusta]
MALKIKAEHFRHLHGQFKSLTSAEIRDVVNKAKSLDVSDAAKDKYIRSTLLRRRVSLNWLQDNLYPYLSDLQIDNALKKITREERIPTCQTY